MFDRVMEQAGRAGAARARAAARRIAAAAAAEAPAGVRVEEAAEGVRLSGRGLRRRMALEPALRWLIGRVR